MRIRVQLVATPTGCITLTTLAFLVGCIAFALVRFGPW